MNESEFEAKLRAFVPAEPSRALLRAIEDELECSTAMSKDPAIVPTEEPEGFLSRLLGGLPWAIGGAAAGIAAILYLDATSFQTRIQALAITKATPQPATAAFDGFQPDEPSQEVIETEQELIFSEEQDPARLVRVSSLERRTWTNPATGARIGVELPREDLMLVPVSYQ